MQIRIVCFSIFIFLSTFLVCNSTIFSNIQPTSQLNQKVIILMLDGFGLEYYRASKMPALNQMEKKGLFKVVPSLMPSVTNVNNAAICTGDLPEKNGITGNSFLDPLTKSEEFMEDSSLVLSPTIFERAQKAGVKSA